jgi:carboxyl-terminal processing protease
MKIRFLILFCCVAIAFFSISTLSISETAKSIPGGGGSPELNITPSPSAAQDVSSKDPKGDTKGPVSDADINRFTNTIVLIKDFYVQPIGDKSLLDNAIRGMVGGLDPHSEYLDGDAYSTLLMTTSGEFGGVGIEVTPEYGILKIVAPMDDTPAAKAGIKSGDYIVAIDGKLVSEMSLQDAVDKMRGKEGSLVTLTVLSKV